MALPHYGVVLGIINQFLLNFVELGGEGSAPTFTSIEGGGANPKPPLLKFCHLYANTDTTVTLIDKLKDWSYEKRV